MTFVYALFSIENDYNQPSNNLCAIWKDKPTFHDIAAFFDFKPRLKDISDLFRGKEVRIGNTDYRIEPFYITQPVPNKWVG